MLFPGFRRPLIVIEDPRKIVDIIARRDKEFDKAPVAIDLFQPVFSGATKGQYSTPELGGAKGRLSQCHEHRVFLRRTAAANIHEATLGLLKLWHLGCSPAVLGDRLFDVHEDFNAALDALWVAVVGEEPGETRYEMAQIQSGIGSRA